MAAPECEREARKRRERRDSGCAHERKERRPHSEERAPPPPPLDPMPPPPPLHDHNRIESERRAERLSRARRPQQGGKRRRPPARIPRQPKENEIFHDDFRCITPPQYEYLVPKPELGELERVETVGRHEEVEHARRNERSVAPRRVQPTADRRLDKINKKISVLKKNITKYENEYEVQNGRSITPSDRITDVQLTRMHETLRKLQAEKRCIKTDPLEYALKAKAAKQQKERDAKLDAALNSDKPMSELVRDIEEWLQGCRELDGRSAVNETRWSGAQLSAEKLCVQRALLRLEAARGRPPMHSAERGAARHLYERYRAVKRALAAARNDPIIGNNGELATIHEHEAIVFNSSLDSSSDSQERGTDSSQQDTTDIIDNVQSLRYREVPEVREVYEVREVREVREAREVCEAGEGSSAGEEMRSSSSAQSAASDDQANAGLHCLGLDDLTRALADAKLHKCVLRRGIKEYEVNFEQQHSRKLQKDDKKGNEEEYIRYKELKAKIKLLNALINKQKTKV
ncbi:PREDICTED: uncharacterized protein LOC106101975 isoform X2 [Papilio polytes]|nr:PREDICTED: uncharacterized protein LOC106101975 isoform X2 [Papilio polytes]XP_013136838.1 PREDICTED: uncharacterized protein LOC106101975 isoform X2 [Papilio polytes]